MNAAVALCGASTLVSSSLAIGALACRRRSVAHWAFLGGMAVLALESALGARLVSAPMADSAVFWQKLRLLAASFVPGCWLLFSLTYSQHDPRLQVSRSLPVLLLTSCSVVLAVLGLWDTLAPTVQGDPFPKRVLFPLTWSGLGVNLFLLLGSVMILVEFERTFRASVGTMRWRIKLMILGLVVVFAARIYTSSQAILFRAIEPAVEAPLLASALLLGCLLMALSFLRSAFAGVVVYPSANVLHGSLTLAFVSIYLLLVGALAKAVTWFGGAAGLPVRAFLLLVGLAGLALVLMSDRLRQRARLLVSHHFKRPSYDYRRTWMAFVEQTNSIVDETELCRSSARLISETLDILSLSIWLVTENRKMSLGASTSIAGGDSAVFRTDDSTLESLFEALRAHPCPFDSRQCLEPWVESLKNEEPGFNSNGGCRIHVWMPLVSHNELMGLISAKDRVNRLEFTVEDNELLKCMGDHLAATLLNRRLSQKLVRAKELEAFQAMSAFVAHDLKNTTHSLSLLLQNLPANFHDPEFRQDAQRAVSNSVRNLNELIRRLTLLRQKLVITPTALDLNAVVKSIVAGMHLRPGEIVVENRQTLLRVAADEEQIRKVLANLILNAKEATGENRRIVITTAPRDRWAVLSVWDNGCGMTSEFLEKSLFRPFQTTKKGGLGIGMFHCKAIVDAHGGRMEVESQPGKGTMIRVLLPCEEKE